MVGHTGNLNATIKAVEAVDDNIERLMKVCLENDYILLVIADHGNAEKMLDENTRAQYSANALNMTGGIKPAEKISEILYNQIRG